MSSLTPFGFIDFTSQIVDQLTTQVNGIITSLVSLSTSLANHVNAVSSVHGVSGHVVGTTDTQTLTNKTVDSASNTINVNGTNINTVISNFVTTSSTQTLTNKTMDGGSNSFTNIPANRVVATSPSQPIISNSSSQLIAVPYLSTTMGGFGANNGTATGVPNFTSGTCTVGNTIGIDNINGLTNTSSNVTWDTGVTNQMIINYFDGYLTDYFGLLVGNVGVNTYVPLLTFTPTSGHSYLAIFYVSTYYTAGPQVGDARGQVSYSRFKNVGGTTTITTNFGNSDSHDYTQNGANVQANATNANNVDFVMWNVAGDTLNMSFYIRLLATP